MPSSHSHNRALAVPTSNKQRMQPDRQASTTTPNPDNARSAPAPNPSTPPPICTAPAQPATHNPPCVTTTPLCWVRKSEGVNKPAHTLRHTYRCAPLRRYVIPPASNRPSALHTLRSNTRSQQHAATHSSPTQEETTSQHTNNPCTQLLWHRKQSQLPAAAVYSINQLPSC